MGCKDRCLLRCMRRRPKFMPTGICPPGSLPAAMQCSPLLRVAYNLCNGMATKTDSLHHPDNEKETNTLREIPQATPPRNLLTAAGGNRRRTNPARSSIFQLRGGWFISVSRCGDCGIYGWNAGRQPIRLAHIPRPTSYIFQPGEVRVRLNPESPRYPC